MMPLGTVKTHAMRGKAKLKTWLSAWHEAADEEQAS
jgi:DNA-directed RNA polymerase specialized sigma24 family protein